ncbi:unnamed protein product [Coffea canephora]|uniref:DH200=94 genomic scaffold, scaffold_1117 n=1 Tax=Coffea canephora TaxID=49390 RepID=A0A068VHZ8_COFCA|nr:unnamed protein product [Coffea canephora]
MTSTSSESSSFISTTGSTIPRGIIFTADCLTVKGTKDVLNKPFSFELSIGRDTMYFMAEFVEGERRLDQLHRMLNCAAFQYLPNVLPHDNAVYRALLCCNSALYDPFGDPKVIGDPYCMIFVGRLSHSTTEETLRHAMSIYGRVKNLRLVRHIG